MFERKGILLLPLFSRSYKLTHQPHAVWLSAAEHKENLTTLQNILTISQQQGAIPELVLYTIPNRDLGKASEGGAVNGKTYLANNMEMAKMIKLFIMKTDRHPVIYLEPDSIAQLLPAVYRRPPDMYPSWVKERLWLLKQSVDLFKQVGCKVFLDVGHSQWIASEQQRHTMVELLMQAGLQQATGIISNISNFQSVSALLGLPSGEAYYLKELVLAIRKEAPALNLQLRVDTSRSLPPELYLQLNPRQFILCPKGRLLEKLPNNTQRRIGHWQGDSLEEASVFPEFGVAKTIEQLIEQESYSLLGNELTAPVWLDPLLPTGKTPLGILPPQRKIEGVETRWIKPPDEADGCLPYHAGASVSLTDKEYQSVNY
ncbi:MAG: glycoside hydrolase family 6 protein [Candidatus Melainabacteria bacterium]|nr:glycoside hydrolase family 6 protein [Candidatus Melainabacteria bacterium]